MTAQKHFQAVLGSLLLSIWACSTPESLNLGAESQTLEENAPPTVDQENVTSTPTGRLVPLDLSGDGFPRVKKYFHKNGQGTSEKLERIEVDLGGDGKIDFIRRFDNEERIVSESSDLDSNGIFEVTTFFNSRLDKTEPEIVRQEISTLPSGAINIWKHFEKNKLTRRDIDRKGLGRPDYWEYYLAGKLTHIERDDDGNGQPDSIPSTKKIRKPKSPEPDKRKRK